MEKIKHKVLALKYRPKNFNELIGQKVMAETITNSIKLNKIPNAYLFTGIRGVGKTTTARIVAKSLNCKNGIENLCKEDMCEHCESITNSNNKHAKTLFPPSHLPKDEQVYALSRVCLGCTVWVQTVANRGKQQIDFFGARTYK